MTKTFKEVFEDTYKELTAPQQVQDRKTGEFYNPQQRFDELMNKPEIIEVFKRLKVR